jgi:exodeoxyribonuclease VII large subunit
MTPSDQHQNSTLTRDILTVTELNQAVARLLEESFDVSWVRGEVSNFTPAASGHWYFTLKDNGASVRAVMFRSRAAAVGFIPKSGDSVELKGRVTLYEARGEYQIQVEQLRRAGLGSLFEAFLALKSKLETEGLFDPQNKRQINSHPRAIGVITSLGAAALRDVLIALERRAPHVPVVIYPAMVQGADSALQLRQALARANERQEVDTLLLVRGGGSIEDLWSFNDEALARDISASVIPVVCGVGHETDFTIADFVADMRAPTPTAAAELVCTARIELADRLLRSSERLATAMQRKIDRLAQRVDRVSVGVVSPGQRLAHQAERLKGLVFRFGSATGREVQRRLTRLDQAQVRLRAQLPQLEQSWSSVQRCSLALAHAQQRLLAQKLLRLESLEAQLRALSPEQTLSRGYAIVLNQQGQVLRSSRELAVGQTLDVRLAAGGAKAKIDTIDLP